jgi:hypothetical protein
MTPDALVEHVLPLLFGGAAAAESLQTAPKLANRRFEAIFRSLTPQGSYSEGHT